MKNWNTGQLALLILGLCAITYWAGLTLKYGSLSFSLVFLSGGALLVSYALWMHHGDLVLADLLPRWLYRTFLSLCIIGLCIFTLMEGFIIYDGHHMDEGEGDIILVLGAGLVQGDQVSQVLVPRLENAVIEHQKSPDTPIIVSGGQGADETISEAAAMKQWLIDHGVEESVIWMEDESTTTSENFLLSMEVMKEHEIASHRITLITNGFHMHRAKYLADLYNLEVYARPSKGLPGAEICFYTREFFGMIKAIIFKR